MLRKESRACKPDKETREWLVLLATIILLALFVSNFLYTLFTFKAIRSQNTKFTDQRQFVSVDTVDNDAINEVEQDTSTMVKKDTSYETEQNESSAVNKNGCYETKQDASTELNKDSSYEINQDASNEIKQGTNTTVNKDTNSEFNNNTSYEINQDMTTAVDKDTISEIKQDASTMDVMESVYKDDDTQSLQYLLTRLLGDENRTKIDSIGFGCDTIEGTTECVTNKPVIINTTTMQVHIQQSPDTTGNTTTVIRPYPQYPNDETTPVTITTTKPTQLPACNYNHQHPALIFSTGGYTGNLFHDFDGLIIPLFITTRLFKSRIQFLIVDKRPSFFDKFKRILEGLTEHEIINTGTNQSVHCFPGAIINLKFHTALGIKTDQPPQNYYSMLDFKDFLRQTYGLKTKSISDMTQKPRPRLLLVSREGTRKFLNEEEMVKMMEELGFEVVIARSAEEMGNIEEFSPVVNSCSVMVGSHGAGMSNEVFLPDGGVVIVVRPLGLQEGDLDVYSWPAPDMGLKYLEYKIRPEESSLVDEYGLDHPVLQNTSSITSKGWIAMAEIYLVKQDFRLDINRFKETVTKAMKLIRSP